jgi:PAS domain S-box-containing protein
MSKPLRVLIVEDSADDAELILNELRRGGYEPVSERVQTAEAMNTALAEKQWEIILADYLMPHFTGMNALRLLQSKKIDIPFIVVSGAIGEEVAVAMMKAGAHDYIMKGNMKRLVPAIQRELRETEVRRERRRAEEALRASEEKFRALFEKLPVGVALVTYDGRSIERNKATMDMHGYDSREEFMKVSTNDLYYDMEDRKRFIELAARGPVRDFEVRHKRKDGSSFWVSQSTIPFVTESGETQLIAVSQDITERKKAEEEIQLKAHLLDSTGDMIYLQDLTGKIIYANDAVCKSHGYTRDEVMQMNIRNLLTPERAEMVSPIAQETLEKGDVKFETQHVCKNGSLVPVEVYNRLIKLDDGYAIIGVGRDITERKKAENELKESEAKFRNLVENAPVGIVVNTVGGRHLSHNKAALEMHGYDSKEEFDRVPVPDLYFDPEDRNRFLESLAKGTVRNFETRHKRKDGSVFWISFTAIPQVGDGGEKQFIVISQDITERKQAEEALKASEEKYRTMVENLPVGVAVSNVEGRSPERNKAFMEMHGYTSREEFDKIPAEELYFNPEDRKRFLSKLGKGAVRNFEIRHKRKDGSPFWISLSAIPQIGEHGEKQSLVICQDIDERKRAEEALRASEERFRSLLENAPVGITVSTTDGQRLEANKALIQMQGFGSREELLAAPVADTYYDPEERKYYMSLLEKGPVQNYELRRKRKDGSVFWASLNSILYTDSSGEKLLINVIADISEHKQAEEALKASEERYRSLVEELPIGIGVSTLEGHSIQRNKAFMEMLGYKTKEELSLVDTPTLYYDPTDRQRFLKLAEKGPVRGFETRFKRQDGTVFWISINSISQVTPSGEILRLNVIQDIDTEKKAEEALHASEEKFRSLLENAPIGISVSKTNSERIEANKAAWEMYGYATKEEFINTNAAAFYADPDERKHFTELLEKGPVQNYEVRRKRKDGSVFWASLSSTYFTASSGEKQLISVTQNIDARKKAEAENELKAQLLDSAGDTIRLIDRAGKIIYANEADYQSHGYSRDEFMKLNMRDLVAPEKTKTLPLRIEETVQKGETRFETVHIRKDGSLMPMEVHNHRVKLGDDYAIITIGRDITERKKAEEQMIVTSRLASIGELTSGVAHEINNPLTSVIGFSELLLERPLPEGIKEDLTTIRDEAQRASRVVKNLLTFTRQHPVSKEPVDVNSIIEKVLELRAYEQKANNIRVVLRLAPDLPKINADYYQLQQVFFNLIVNAEYFMTEAHNKGTLTITTENLDDAVGISFADDGPGISAESLQHLFNPFFTTKPVGKGTGLGLSICHGIITAHNGKIYAESTYGKGATFFVEIPFTR